MSRSFSNEINISDYLGVLDWFVFCLIFLLTVISVIYGNHLKNKNDTQESLLDFLLMGRMLTLPMFVATLVATWYGGIFGVTRIAFEKGIYNFITQGVFWYITYVIFALFLVDRVRGSNAVTLPELIGQMFGPRSRKLSAIFNFFNVIPIAYAISVGLFLSALFGIDPWQGTLLGTLGVVAYSAVGGFRSVVFSDLIQFGVMCLGVALVFIFSWWEFGGIDFLQRYLPVTHFTPTGGESLFSTFAWGLIAFSTLVDPNFYQRCFAARTPGVAKKGILISTGVWILFDICTTAGAMYARAVIPDADSGQAYLVYALQLLPHGFRGFFLAGILATILSTMDSYIFVAGTTVSYDLAPQWLRAKGFSHVLGIVLVGILSVLLASFFDGNIEVVWKTLGSYSAACLLLPVLWGYRFPQSISDGQFVFTCLMGVIATTLWRNVDRTGIWMDVDEIYAGAFVTLAILLTQNYLTRRKPCRPN